MTADQPLSENSIARSGVVGGLIVIRYSKTRSCFKLGISDLKDVRSNFLTLVVQSTISFILFLLHKLLQRGLALISLGKCGSLLIKVTLTELSISNLRHTFTLN